MRLIGLGVILIVSVLAPLSTGAQQAAKIPRVGYLVLAPFSETPSPERAAFLAGLPGLPRPSYDRSLHALRTWLDSWADIGRVAVGMARQGYDLQLTRYDEKGWRARST